MFSINHCRINNHFARANAKLITKTERINLLLLADMIIRKFDLKNLRKASLIIIIADNYKKFIDNNSELIGNGITFSQVDALVFTMAHTCSQVNGREAPNRKYWTMAEDEIKYHFRVSRSTKYKKLWFYVFKRLSFTIN